MTYTSTGMIKINTRDLKADMVLAADITNDRGAVIFAKDMMLNQSNYEKLVSNGVRYAYIKVASVNKLKPSLSDTETAIVREIKIPVQETKEFINFNAGYQKNTEEIKSVIHAISDGAEIKVDELAALTNNIISGLKCKSDIFSYMSHLQSTDEHTFAHSNNVSLLANLFGQWIDLSEEELMYLTTAGILHDIGKTKIMNEILNKKTKLTDEEFEHIKKHPTLGYRMLESQKIPDDIKLSALMHHEKVDGSGYPLGIKGPQINRFAKVIAICDIYDAMTANRVYRDKICPFTVIKDFEHSVFGLLDTEYLLLFLKNIAYTYIGNDVQLTDGTIGEVAFINVNTLSRPMIKTATDVIDLSVRKDLEIIRMV